MQLSNHLRSITFTVL